MEGQLHQPFAAGQGGVPLLMAQREQGGQRLSSRAHAEPNGGRRCAVGHPTVRSSTQV